MVGQANSHFQAGLPEVDLAADRLEFKRHVSTALEELSPRDGETIGQTFVRHDGGAAIAFLVDHRYKSCDTDELESDLSKLFDGLIALREQAFSEDPYHRDDESAGWTADALDRIGDMLGRDWRPNPVGVITQLIDTIRNGDDEARRTCFADDAYYEISSAIVAMKKQPEPEALMKELQTAIAQHQGQLDYLNDVVHDWFISRKTEISPNK